MGTAKATEARPAKAGRTVADPHATTVPRSSLHLNRHDGEYERERCAHDPDSEQRVLTGPTINAVRLMRGLNVWTKSGFHREVTSG